MCHLAVEKALKGLYHERLRDVPPRSHNLVYLLKKTETNPPEAIGKFLVRLSQSSIPTRYPENLARIQQLFTESIVGDILSRGKEVIEWIKQQLSK
jgi:HEPN domain-containing protein